MFQKWFKHKTLNNNVIVLLLLLCISNCFAQDITTDEKKVILIFKFADYIEWTKERDLDTFRIGIFSDDESLINNLKIFETVKIKNKVISLTRFYNVSEIDNIQLLIISDDKNYLSDKIAEHINNREILLISDRCKKQEHVMINFIYSNDKKLDFEVNKANILKEGLAINPDLLLLGGTEVDIAALYKESQKTLTEIQKQVHDLKEKHSQQERELAMRDQLLQSKNQEIIEKTENISKQNRAIQEQRKELNTLTNKVSEKDKILEQDLAALKKLQKELKGKSTEIEKSNEILHKLNEEINQKQKRINKQETEISGYETTVDQQKTVIYLVVSSLAMLLLTIIFVFRGFINKKKTAQVLAKKEAEIRLLFDNAPLPLFMTEPESEKLIYANHLGLNMFKIDLENNLNSISTKSFYVDSVHREKVLNQLKKEKSLNNVEMLLKDSTGKQFYGSLSGLLTQYENTKVLFLAVKDISEIRNAINELNSYKEHLEVLVKERSQKLIESQRRFKDMAELLPETIFEMKPKGEISFINKRGMEMFGLNDTTLKNGLNLFSLSNEPGEMKSILEDIISAKKIQATEFQFKRSNGGDFPGIVYMNYHIKEEKAPIIRGIIVNITERKSLERKILNTMIETEEKERKRFAEDLHDGLGSLLSSLSLYVDLLDNPELSGEDKEKLFSTLRSIIDESIKNSKEISNNLRPSTLTRFGLAGSLKSFCDKINDTNKINISLDHAGLKVKLNSNTENALYRITNELINNTLKYASAKNAWIHLENRKGKVFLNYKDDGVGFDKNKALESGGMGLKNIYARVNSIDGSCNIKSKQGEGIMVSIEVNTDAN